MSTVLISDPTLRDGSHAVRHQLTREQMYNYMLIADAAGIPIIEVGHGNGLGASSLQLGESLVRDEEIFELASSTLRHTKIGIHVIPGVATINDLKAALDLGVHVVRVASHCTEADITKRHIEYALDRGREAYGVLMMSHMASIELLTQEALKMQSYGAHGVIIMDSAGVYLPEDVIERVKALTGTINIPVGFHAHNNLGHAIANSVAALSGGARILDGTIRGFGAGAGNAQLEVLIAVLNRLGYTTNIDLSKLLEGANIAEKTIIEKVPTINSTSVISGLAGVFSGFAKPVELLSQKYNVDPHKVFMELGRRKIIAGQEDMIIEVVHEIAESEAVVSN
ncbi:4-hydroxy-2-oxovalerate aldolase [Paenibacillus sp. sptzw28]|uniref:4-hydroxy-2-oxovalerate aldolase n=1 Tax=Paenibacillus sp. sptzw28 TaxID=715179 RepID=UPI001C6EB391|nr:4-hydroxy-2-oxovalerate aldolase [Paenibacillus sp. sptzw28]QYR21014.1 4-hydroxy-2-oxovalerate aldolase [Paenibacillus sp. sptzw28]